LRRQAIGIRLLPDFVSAPLFLFGSFGLRETLALLFSGISYRRSRDSNEIGGTISIHPVIDELSRVIKSFYPLFVFTVFLRENGLKQDVNVAWPFGALPESPGLDQKKAL